MFKTLEKHTMKIKKSELEKIIREEIQKTQEGGKSDILDKNGNVYGSIKNLFQEAGEGIPAPGAESMFMIRGSDDEIIDTLVRGYMESGWDPKDMFEREGDARAIINFYEEDVVGFNQKMGTMYRSLEPETQEKVTERGFADRFYTALRDKQREFTRNRG